MSAETGRTYKSECVDCGSPLEFYEIDFDKGRQIMQFACRGLYHSYKKAFFGKWKLVKAGCVSDLWMKYGNIIDVTTMSGLLPKTTCPSHEKPLRGNLVN